MVTISNYFNSSASTWFKSIEHLHNKEIFEFYINHFQTCIELFFFPHARREKKENEGRGQSFETLNPLLPIFWIETEAQINRSNLSLSKTNLSSRISRLRKRYFTNIERQKWHTPSSLPQLEYRIETVIPPPFPPFFSIYHWQTRDRGGGSDTAWRTIFPDIESFSARETVRSSSFGRAFGDVSLSRRILATTTHPPVMADGVKGDQRWPRFFRSFEISTKLVQGEFRSNEEEEGKRREKMRESRRRELSRGGGEEEGTSFRTSCSDAELYRTPRGVNWHLASLLCATFFRLG